MSQIGFFGGSGGGGGGTVNTLTGNTGTATAVAGNINVVGDTGNNITTSATGSTVTIAVTGNTNHALVVGNAAGSLDSLAVATNGQIPIGSTGANPIVSALTAGTGISITNGAGSITIAATGGGAGIEEIDFDTGSITPTTGVVSLVGGDNITTSGTGSTGTIAVSGTTQFAVQIGSAAGSLDDVSGLGTTGQVLTSNGPGVAPTWQASGGVKPAFNYYASSTQSNVTGDATLYTVIFDTQLYDTTSSFDGVSTFTAPVTGIYDFNVVLYMQGVDASQTIAVLYFMNPINGNMPVLDVNGGSMADANANLVVNGNFQVELQAAQTMQVGVLFIGGGKTVDVYGAAAPSWITSFSGFLIA